MQRCRWWVALIAVALAGRPALAADGAGDTREAPAGPRGLYIEVPLLDAPFNFTEGVRFPSMEQSLGLSAGFYGGVHYGLGRVLDPFAGEIMRRWAGRILILAFDIFTPAVPLALGWQHEEWHRAVMGRHGISSFNDIYHLRLFADVIAVSHVSDEDLIRLKAEHPADQVRMSTAGIEGNYALVHRLERIAFFQDPATWDVGLLWLLDLQNTLYLATCAGTDSDRVTNEMRAREGTDIAIRDFTGLDCNGWVYDLFRPDEPYAARGVHPSGTGINRYRSFSELAPAEQAYLRQQSRLSVLSLVDPQLLGFRRFTVAWGEGPPLAFNAALRYLPAAFGWNLRADLFAQRGPLGLVLALHGYFNQVRVLPGIDAALVGFPFAAVGAAVLSLDLRLALWLQPSGLRFATEASTPGALGALRLTARRGPAAAFAEVEAKSAGWVAGNVYLDANVSARVGAAVHFLR